MQKGVIRKRRPKSLSEYGRQLAEKQELRGQYNLRERQFSNYVKEALAKGSRAGDAPSYFMQKLERRLDSVVYRMGLATTRKQSRQMVTHGHFRVNGRPLDVPSYQVVVGDVVSVHPSSVEKTLLKNAKIALKKYEAPSWLKLDKEKVEAEVTALPQLTEVAPATDLALVFEFYSR